MDTTRRRLFELGKRIRTDVTRTAVQSDTCPYGTGQLTPNERYSERGPISKRRRSRPLRSTTTPNGDPNRLKTYERTRLPGKNEKFTKKNNRPNAREPPRTHEDYVDTSRRYRSVASPTSRYIPSSLRTHRKRIRRDNEYAEPTCGRGNYGSTHGSTETRANTRKTSAEIIRGE